MADDELVERRARRHEDANSSRSAAGAAELLPRRGDRPWISDQHRALQASNVDAELEGVGADNPRDLSAAQTRLDLAAVKREVAGAVAADAARGIETRVEVLPQVAEHHLDRKPAATEHDRLHARANP